MQLKHDGRLVQVTLTRPEQRLLEKTAYLLEGMALLPCNQKNQKDQADTAAKLVAKLAKQDYREPSDEQGDE